MYYAALRPYWIWLSAHPHGNQGQNLNEAFTNHNTFDGDYLYLT